MKLIIYLIIFLLSTVIETFALEPSPIEEDTAHSALLTYLNANQTTEHLKAVQHDDFIAGAYNFQNTRQKEFREFCGKYLYVSIPLENAVIIKFFQNHYPAPSQFMVSWVITDDMRFKNRTVLLLTFEVTRKSIAKSESLSVVTTNQ